MAQTQPYADAIQQTPSNLRIDLCVDDCGPGAQRFLVVYLIRCQEVVVWIMKG